MILYFAVYADTFIQIEKEKHSPVLQGIEKLLVSPAVFLCAV